jgi:hypothetical protein
MYVTISIGAMLLGGWVLSPTDETRDEATAPAPQAAAPYLPLMKLLPPTAPSTGPGGQQPGRQQQPERPNFMPMVPTEAAPGLAARGPGLVPPTQPMPAEGTGGGPQAAGAYGPAVSRIPMAPTYRQPSLPPAAGATGAYSPFAQQEQQRMAAWMPQKAFANYQPPPSGSSPYMNLWRTGTNNGTIDNYTTLVRPALQQQNANQQFGNDIFGLQRAERIQRAAIQQVNPQSRYLQGIGTPQYYMNTGGYYPGMYGP